MGGWGPSLTSLTEVCSSPYFESSGRKWAHLKAIFPEWHFTFESEQMRRTPNDMQPRNSVAPLPPASRHQTVTRRRFRMSPSTSSLRMRRARNKTHCYWSECMDPNRVEESGRDFCFLPSHELLCAERCGWCYSCRRHQQSTTETDVNTRFLWCGCSFTEQLTEDLSSAANLGTHTHRRCDTQ